jgi:hypothetical protein
MKTINYDIRGNPANSILYQTPDSKWHLRGKSSVTTGVSCITIHRRAVDNPFRSGARYEDSLEIIPFQALNIMGARMNGIMFQRNTVNKLNGIQRMKRLTKYQKIQIEMDVNKQMRELEYWGLSEGDRSDVRIIYGL